MSETYESLKAKLKNRNTKKLANNTYIVRIKDFENQGKDLGIMLHSTMILRYSPDGEITVDSGGWKTVTTKARINEYLPGHGIYQEKGIWYWALPYPERAAGLRKPFTDGDWIDKNGKLHTQAKASDSDRQAKLRKRIDKYAKLCADSLPLSTQNCGDCFYCHMATEKEGTPLGDAIKDVSHLESHMKEGYVVPSLVYNALKETGAAPATWWGTFKPSAPDNPDEVPFTSFARHGVRQAVNVYMRKRFGLPV